MKKTRGKQINGEHTTLIFELEAEIRRLKTQLLETDKKYRTAINELQTSNEELRTAGEELQTTNEELRTVTEELQTNKKSLESVNLELINVNTELTAQIKEVHRFNADWKNLMLATDIATIFLDKALRINRYTPSAADLFNLVPSDVGRPLSDIAHHLDYKNLSKDAECTFTALERIEREAESSDGRYFILRILPYLSPGNQVDGVVINFIDITHRKQIEEALKEADRRKDEFLATLAHELRNPLAPIRSGLQLFKRAKADEQMIIKVFEIIERQTNQLVHLVNDLLDVSRITYGKINLQKSLIDLSVAVNAALETCQPLIEAKKHKLNVRIPEQTIFVEADVTRLAQILINVLNNAAKYTDPGGEISIRVSSENDQAVIRIRDNGVGLAPDKIKSIFDIFTQIKGKGAGQGGLGIGLSLAKQLTEMHDGTIEAISAGVGKGSEFILCLPLSKKSFGQQENPNSIL